MGPKTVLTQARQEGTGLSTGLRFDGEVSPRVTGWIFSGDPGLPCGDAGSTPCIKGELHGDHTTNWCKMEQDRVHEQLRAETASAL